jgi:hypothetical protein
LSLRVRIANIALARRRPHLGHFSRLSKRSNGNRAAGLAGCAAKEAMGYPKSMVVKILKDVIEQAETWPQQDQEELAEYAQEIQARRTGVYIMSDEERAAVRRGLAQADRGDFVSDDVVAEADKRHDL